MWLLDTTTLALSAFFDENTPHYAILSHTWGSEEVSFQDIQGPHETISNRNGYHKIKGFCSKALEAGFQYVWVDTCCIDKANNAELSEAINSMYRWYSNAVTCYAYLEDVAPLRPLFTNSRWFRRGWTLQELIAPPEVLFFDFFWHEIGSRAGLAPEIEKTTRIPVGLLTTNTSLEDHCVAEILSWAAGRQTTRTEDRAYSLLGLFRVSMPLIYGEGAHAFVRLQLEIIKSTTDHSIFASQPELFYQGAARGAFAPSVDEFEYSGHVRSLPASHETSFEMTNLGLRISLPCALEQVEKNGCRHLIAYLNCKFEHRDARLGISLIEASSKEGKPLGRFHRFGPLKAVSPGEHNRREIQPMVLHIIQPTYEYPHKREEIPRPRPCSLDYGDLIEAGYLVERFLGPSDRPLYKDDRRIIFEFEQGLPFPHTFGGIEVISQRPPWIIIFKHVTQPTRFWILFGLYRDKLCCTIKNDSSNEDPPESINEAQMHQHYRSQNTLPVLEHAAKEQLYYGEMMKLSVKRALIWNRIGYMTKIALEE
ncbi:hypothetical protein EG329_006849 [Mollisiaceae sp. DMI_Dod_QoI]|nr:hypothetical protein EG329_006849 [Helotiales sp. DMI_Dod_QoI]